MIVVFTSEVECLNILKTTLGCSHGCMRIRPIDCGTALVTDKRNPNPLLKKFSGLIGGYRPGSKHIVKTPNQILHHPSSGVFCILLRMLSLFLSFTMYFD